jgi:hypothetical protein
MNRKELLADRDRMYVLTEDAIGQLYLEVVVGGIAMYTVDVALSKEEAAAYIDGGKAELDNLAYKICKNPEAFRFR